MRHLAKYRPSLDFHALLLSAFICKMAYCPPEEVLQRWKRSKVAEVEANDILSMHMMTVQSCPVYITSPVESQEDAQAYFWVSRDTMYLAFRGTSSKQDFMADGKVIPHPLILAPTTPTIKVHKGFYDQYTSIEEQILSCITTYEQTMKNLVVCGHSLGGALSQLACVILKTKYPSLGITCHTYGSPRVGNRLFAETLTKCVDANVRVTNRNDPVPMMPMTHVWKHNMDTSIVIEDSCKFILKTQDTPWYCRLCTSLGDIDFANPVQDHSCDEYINRVTQITYYHPQDNAH